MKIRFGPDGTLLFDRLTGLNVLVDELIAPEHLWSTAPRQVSVALTNACNLSCPFCYAPKHRAALATDRLSRWAVELDRAGSLGLGFGGGEPTLYKHFTDVCAYVAENTGLAVSVTTHGHRWTADLIAALRGAVNFVRVSVDGVGDTYERVRGKSFARLRECLDAIGSEFQWGINTVVNDETVGDLDAIAALAAHHGASELLLLPERPTRAGPGISEGARRALEGWVRSYSDEVPLSISADAAIGVPIAEPLPRELGLRSYAHIDASGTLRSSSYSPTGVSIGEDGVMAALERLAMLEAA